MRARPGEHMSFIETAAVSDTDDCILWPFGRGLNGYGQMKFGGKTRGAHRVVLILSTGVDPPDMDAAHGPCHTCHCVNPKHLSWKTCKENTHDKRRDGTVRSGTTS